MTSHQVLFLLLDFALILLLARALGALAGRIGQPPVMGEILAGVLMGPTLFGSSVSDRLFPADIRPLLGALAQIGVALFMFVVGLELEHRVLRGRVRLTLVAAAGSTLVPFAFGVPLALYLLRHHPTEQHAAFVVFMGLSVSVTAFPVLSRILVSRGMSRTAIGGLALATAAVVDVVAWSALAGVQAVVGGADYWQVTLLVPFAGLLLAVRPLLRRVFTSRDAQKPLTPTGMAVVMVGIFLSGAATEAMGMHYIFGTFLFGALLPREGMDALREEICDRTGEITSLLLPVYFVVAGLKVDLRGVGLDGLTELGVILLVAIGGKFGGTYLGARSHDLPARDSATLAALMNTRGLTELVILGVGLELGLLDGSLYSLMVVMALVTTAMTGPLLTLIDAKRSQPLQATAPDKGAAAHDAGEGVPGEDRDSRTVG
ncbi:Kef-type K+ transport system, membrane component KefB [Streptomyces sp. yr375]|uniref:cation:proton antiporter n=1 Tax=Streptomyces sp. yr375 TaxID=1761906 RepID=UPI0008CADA9A|nr:cation:proton antiporter [Streptomyces sp. yr375]SEQ07647.1 Kef-type K+ transport system, membrane component KefB [Streptomyces sp. yr375]